MLQTQMQRRRSQSVRQTRPQRVLRFAVLQIIASMQRRFLLDGRQWGFVNMTNTNMLVTTPVSFNTYLIGLACDSGGGVFAKGISYNSAGKINIFSSAASSSSGNVGTNWAIVCR